MRIKRKQGDGLGDFANRTRENGYCWFSGPLHLCGSAEGNDGSLRFLQRLRFPYFQFRLAPVGGFGRVYSRLQIGFLKKVAPALVTIRWVLGFFELFHF